MSLPVPPQAEVDFRRRPRNRKPSARNLAIHRAYCAGLHSQEELAQMFGLSQRRISRIIVQVDRWLLVRGPQADPLEQAKAAWHVRFEQLKAIIDGALRAHAQTRRVLYTRRHRGGKLVSETCREVNPDMQWLKIAMQASDQLKGLMANAPPGCELPRDVEHSGGPSDVGGPALLNISALPADDDDDLTSEAM